MITKQVYLFRRSQRVHPLKCNKSISIVYVIGEVFFSVEIVIGTRTWVLRLYIFVRDDQRTQTINAK